MCFGSVTPDIKKTVDHLLLALLFVFVIFCGTIHPSDAEKLVISQQIVVDPGQSVVYDNSVISIAPAFAEESVFIVKNGAELRFTGNSVIDLGNLGNKRLAEVESEGSFVLDHSSIENDCQMSEKPIILINNGNFEMLNGSAIKNVQKRMENFLRMESGSLKIIDSFVLNNSARYRSSEGAYYNSMFSTDGTEIIIRNTEFKNNSFINGLFYADNDGSITVSGSVFSENKYGCITGKYMTLNLEKGNQFTRNDGGYNSAGAIYLEYSTFNAADDNQFIGNRTQNSTGAVSLYKGKAEIGAAYFSENTGTYGGALRATGCELVISGTVFESNKAVSINTESQHKSGEGGAITGGGTWTIRNARFLNNEAASFGGAVCVGGPLWTVWAPQNYPIDRDFYSNVTIENTVFRGNKVIDCEYEAAGGALFIDVSSHVKMRDMVMTNNTAAAGGGGIASMSSSITKLKQRHGAMIFGNRDGRTTGGNGDLYLTDHTAPFEIHEKMFTGDLHHWNSEGPFLNAYVTSSDGYGTIAVETEGAIYFSVPDQAYDGEASVVFEDNYSYSSDYDGYPYQGKIPLEMRANGGAIANRGYLEVGDDSVTLRVHKIWNDNDDEKQKRPGPEEFLRSLSVTADGERIDFGTLQLLEKKTVDGTDTYLYDVSGDSYVMISLTDPHDSTYDVEISGLPKEEGEHEIVYDVSESVVFYSASGSGDVESGFEFINTYAPELISFEVETVWRDNADAEGKRPAPEDYFGMLELIMDESRILLDSAVLTEETTHEDGSRSWFFSIPEQPQVRIILQKELNDRYRIRFEDFLMHNDSGDVIDYQVFQPELPDYSSEYSGKIETGFIVINTLVREPEPEPDGPALVFFRLRSGDGILPRTGISGNGPDMDPLKNDSFNYGYTGLVLQIPRLSVRTDVVTVPYQDGSYPVSGLKLETGLLDGSALPGDGISILTGHNHLDKAHAGPFARIKLLEEGDVIFVSDERNALQAFAVSENLKLQEDDIDSLECLSGESDDLLILITCEDERPEGGYAGRRVIAAKPL